MTERVGLRTGFEHAHEGVLCIVQKGIKGWTTKETVGLEWDNEGNREKRELRKDASFKKTCGCDMHDDMMKCNKQK